MPRHPRVHAPHFLYHVIVRGNNKQTVFDHEEDYRMFQDILSITQKKYPFILYAYALMPNHIHMLIEVREMCLSRIMQSLLTSYVRRFNKKYTRVGHLFQARYKAIICAKDAYAMELVRYIHLNPVRAGLAAAPGDWKWSGHSEYTGSSSAGIVSSGVMQELFGSGDSGYMRYILFLQDGIGKKYEEKYHPGEGHPFLGADKPAQDPLYEMNCHKMTLEQLFQQECKSTGFNEDVVLGKTTSRVISRARAAFIMKAVREQGYKIVEVAHFLNCNPSSVTRAIQNKQIKQD